MDRVIVTGAAGFIGSHLADALIADNVQVLGIDNMSSGLEKNFEHHIYNNSKYEIIFEDICSKDLIYIFRDFRPQIVFHLAAIPGVSYSVENPVESNKVNVEGTLNLLECSKRFKVQRFIFSSSSSIYGGADILPTPEAVPASPKSPYAMQKLFSEKYCSLYASQYGLDTVSLRYFNVFGKRQRNDSAYAAVIAAFAKAKKDNIRPVIYGDGSQYRDFCHVDNVVRANILAARHDGKFYGDVFNVGCGKPTTVDELLKMIGCRKPKYEEERAGDVKCSNADISKIKNVLNYEPNLNFQNLLDETIEWYLNN